MKPRTGLQIRIAELSKQLPAITKAQQEQAYKNCFEHIGRRTAKGVISCLECGYQWKGSDYLPVCTCPACRTHLKVEDTPQRIFKQVEYFCIITVVEEFQVLRFFYLTAYNRVGSASHRANLETVQQWIAPAGNVLPLRDFARDFMLKGGYGTARWNFGTTVRSDITSCRRLSIRGNGLFPKLRVQATGMTLTVFHLLTCLRRY